LTKTELTGFYSAEIDDLVILADRCLIYEECCIVLLQQNQPVATIEGFVASESHFKDHYIKLEVIKDNRPPKLIYLRSKNVSKKQFSIGDTVYRTDERFADNLTCAQAALILITEDNQDVITKKRILKALAWKIMSFNPILPTMAIIQQEDREVPCLLKNLVTEQELKLQRERIEQ
jgi:hypothetical protein